MPLSSILKKTPPSTKSKNQETSETTNNTNNKLGIYLDALQKLKDNDYTPLNDSSDSISVAIDQLHDQISDNMHSALENMVELSMQSSESLAAISFVTGDMREVADNTQAIAAAIDELSATSSDISRNSHDVVDNSRVTQEAITAGNAAVESSVESIDLITKSIDTANNKIQNLSEAVQAIVEILGTIESIAKQTNLLALNATIEAARAGDAGKGFAVVATEVKTLAGQTADATEDIREKISAISTGMTEVSDAMIESVTATDTGRGNIHKAGEEINQVVKTVEKTTELMASVASSVTEEDAAISEIAKSIETIKEKTNRAASNADISSDVTIKTAKVVDEQLLIYRDMDIPNSILDFAKSDHVLWKKKLAAMLSGDSALSSDALSDHHHCALGKWYHDIQDLKIKNHDSFIKLEEVHSKVHTFGKKCAELFEKGDRIGATEQYERMSEASEKVLQYLTDIKASIDK